MITLKDIELYNNLEQRIKIFLCQKCEEYRQIKIKYDIIGCYWIKYNYDLLENYDYFELCENIIEICFMKYGRSSYEDDEYFAVTLPLDILFDVDFKDKMESRLKDELEVKRLRKLEEEKQRIIRQTEKEEAKKYEDKLLMFTLMEQYPEDAKKKIEHDNK